MWGRNFPAHPRSRGENVRRPRDRVTSVGSSPLTRGKLVRSPRPLFRGRLIPAHAGKTGLIRSRTVVPRAHPRSRGENSLMMCTSVFLSGLIPAHAGKTLASAGIKSVRPAHPRSRGENGRNSAFFGLFPGSSPLTRGKRLPLYRRWTPSRLIPAHAGKTSTRQPARPPGTAHPRSRGENSVRDNVMDIWGGSSPLTRGKQGGSQWLPYGPRLIPAHAGKTGVIDMVAQDNRAHPRSRGENIQTCVQVAADLGSSPLTRGKHPGQSPTSPGYGLIPAHAGKTSAGW